MTQSLVTGGAGFMGSHVASELLSKGHSVLICDDLSGGFIDNVPDGARFLQGSSARMRSSSIGSFPQTTLIMCFTLLRMLQRVFLTSSEGSTIRIMSLEVPIWSTHRLATISNDSYSRARLPCMAQAGFR